MVEDEPLVRAHVVRLLTNLGHQTLSAQDGQSALQVLEDGEDFDLLFTDIVMPGAIDGVALAEHTRRLLPDIKILLTSGYAEAAVLQARKHIPGAELLSKPYRLKDLREKLDLMFGYSCGSGHASE